MKKKDLFTLKRALESVSQLQGVKFAYAIAKNLHVVMTEITPLMKSVEPHPVYVEYDKKRLALCREYSKKDEKGEPVVSGTDYLIEDPELFNAEIAKLKDEYRAGIATRELQMREYVEILEEPCEVVLFKISDDLLPENINAEQIFGIMEIIDQGEDEKGLTVVK